MKNELNLSIVIPTNGRVALVERLLKSLSPEIKSYPYGKVEIIVVNSGSKDESAQIEALCGTYSANFHAGDNSVRKKRNLGIKVANYEVILFLDSDVAAKEGLLAAHAKEYLYNDDDHLGGVFGLTEFVGEKTWWWKVVEQTTYLDSFSFAKRFPYNHWTIGNNVSFYRSVLLEIGLFEENFPFPLGGDDLDLSYRITKAGYHIKSCPDAVTFHSTETWNNPKAIHNRTRRWGSMEYYISKRHSELFVNCIPKSGILFLIAVILSAITSVILKSVIPLLFVGVWIVIHFLIVYIYDCIHAEGGNLFYYLLGKTIRGFYRLFYHIESIKHGHIDCIHKEMSFSFEQTKHMQKRESAVFIIFLSGFIVLLLTFLIYFRFFVV